MAKIITTYVKPPIPSRSFDWSAHYDGDEEGFVGNGETEAKAIEELLDLAECLACGRPNHEVNRRRCGRHEGEL